MFSIISFVLANLSKKDQIRLLVSQFRNTYRGVRLIKLLQV